MGKHIQNTKEVPSAQVFETERDSTVKVLGMHCQSATDTLGYRVNLSNLADSTKRQVLSTRIFDPLGLLAPVVVRFKRAMAT